MLHSLFNTICHGDDVSHLVATTSLNPVQNCLPFQPKLLNKTLCDFAMLPAIVHLHRHMSNMHKKLQTCTQFHLLLQAEAAARKLGFQVKTLDCDLAPNAHVHPVQPVYVWEQSEDSAHEKPKVLARLHEELALSNKELQATAVFAKPLAVVSKLHHGLHC